jgi:hypothetical protein
LLGFRNAAVLDPKLFELLLTMLHSSDANVLQCALAAVTSCAESDPKRNLQKSMASEKSLKRIVEILTDDSFSIHTRTCALWCLDALTVYPLVIGTVRSSATPSLTPFLSSRFDSFITSGPDALPYLHFLSIYAKIDPPCVAQIVARKDVIPQLCQIALQRGLAPPYAEAVLHILYAGVESEQTREIFLRDEERGVLMAALCDLARTKLLEGDVRSLRVAVRIFLEHLRAYEAVRGEEARFYSTRTSAPCALSLVALFGPLLSLKDQTLNSSLLKLLLLHVTHELPSAVHPVLSSTFSELTPPLLAALRDDETASSAVALLTALTSASPPCTAALLLYPSNFADDFHAALSADDPPLVQSTLALLLSLLRDAPALIQPRLEDFLTLARRAVMPLLSSRVAPIVSAAVALLRAFASHEQLRRDLIAIELLLPSLEAAALHFAALDGDVSFQVTAAIVSLESGSSMRDDPSTSSIFVKRPQLLRGLAAQLLSAPRTIASETLAAAISAACSVVKEEGGAVLLLSAKGMAAALTWALYRPDVAVEDLSSLLSVFLALMTDSEAALQLLKASDTICLLILIRAVEVAAVAFSSLADSPPSKRTPPPPLLVAAARSALKILNAFATPGSIFAPPFRALLAAACPSDEDGDPLLFAALALESRAQAYAAVLRLRADADAPSDKPPSSSLRLRSLVLRERADVLGGGGGGSGADDTAAFDSDEALPYARHDAHFGATVLKSWCVAFFFSSPQLLPLPDVLALALRALLAASSRPLFVKSASEGWPLLLRTLHAAISRSATRLEAADDAGNPPPLEAAERDLLSVALQSCFLFSLTNTPLAFDREGNEAVARLASSPFASHLNSARWYPAATFSTSPGAPPDAVGAEEFLFVVEVGSQPQPVHKSLIDATFHLASALVAAFASHPLSFLSLALSVASAAHAAAIPPPAALMNAPLFEQVIVPRLLAGIVPIARDADFTPLLPILLRATAVALTRVVEGNPPRRWSLERDAVALIASASFIDAITSFVATSNLSDGALRLLSLLTFATEFNSALARHAAFQPLLVAADLTLVSLGADAAVASALLLLRNLTAGGAGGEEAARVCVAGLLKIRFSVSHVFATLTSPLAQRSSSAVVDALSILQSVSGYDDAVAHILPLATPFFKKLNEFLSDIGEPARLCVSLIEKYPPPPLSPFPQ